MLRLGNEQLTIWDETLAAEFRKLPEELVRGDR